MIRDEEKPVHALPETRTMSAREALAEACFTSLHGWTDMPERLSDLSAEARKMALLNAAFAMEYLARLGFGIYERIPEPRGR